LPVEKRPCVSGGWLAPFTYCVEQFHIHWGAILGYGSEHKVNYQRYEAELHIVHHRIIYDSVTAAATADPEDPNALAVLGFLHRNFVKDGQSPVDVIMQRIDDENLGERLAAKDSEPIFDRIRIADVLSGPDNLYEYFAYEGGLTTPQCNPIVRWVLFKEPTKYNTELNVSKFPMLAPLISSLSWTACARCVPPTATSASSP